MRIIKGEELITIKEALIFSRYESLAFEDLLIKDDFECGNGCFFAVSIVESVDSDGAQEFVELVEDAENGASIDVDFECPSRYDSDEHDKLFAVWERKDVEKLIQKLQEALTQYPETI